MAWAAYSHVRIAEHDFGRTRTTGREDDDRQAWQCPGHPAAYVEVRNIVRTAWLYLEPAAAKHVRREHGREGNTQIKMGTGARILYRGPPIDQEMRPGQHHPWFGRQTVAQDARYGTGLGSTGGSLGGVLLGNGTGEGPADMGLMMA